MKSSHIQSYIPENIEDYASLNIVIDPLNSGHYSQYKRLALLNQVNTHIFKPTFYEKDPTNLIAVVASYDVANQTKKAILRYLGEQKSIKIDISGITGQESLEELFRNVYISENVIIGNIKSSVDALVIYLISKRYGQHKADEIECELGLSRLDENTHRRIETDLRTHLAYIWELLNTHKLKIESGISVEVLIENVFFQTVKVTIEGRSLTIVQRPWGRDLSKALSNFLNEKVKSVYLIGGCASLDEKHNIDDILIPTECFYEEEIYKQTGLNMVEKQKQSKLLNEHSNRVHLAKFYTVDTSISHVGLLEKLKEADISAIEMELAYLLNEMGNIQFFPMFYIMDKPLENISLSNTYYDYEFLKSLASKKNRGKNICYQTALELILKS